VGDVIRNTFWVRPLAIPNKNRTAGSTFTVLVSPEDENDTLPYFLITDLQVIPVEASQVSHDVSARVAAQIVTQPARSFDRLGEVEPELCVSAPRRVRLTRDQVRLRGFIVGIYATLVTLYFAAPQFGLPIARSKQDLFFFQICIQAMTIPLLLQSKSRNLLVNGVAIRALIIAEEDMTESERTSAGDRTISFSYQYEQDGVLRNGSFEMKRRRAWRLGIGKDATFTVLCDPKDQSIVQPYFQISSFEIVGAMGPKITPH
jgi:hypothetical protein